MTDREQLLAWAATCDEIATLVDQEAVAVSAEFCALRLRRMVTAMDSPATEDEECEETDA